MMWDIAQAANESATLRKMIPSLTSLETQLDQLLERYRSLRGENALLLAKVAELEACKRALQTKIDITAARLETLKSALPVE